MSEQIGSVDANRSPRRPSAERLCIRYDQRRAPGMEVTQQSTKAMMRWPEQHVHYRPFCDEA